MNLEPKPQKSIKRKLVEVVTGLSMGLIISYIGTNAGMGILPILSFSLVIGIALSWLFEVFFPVKEEKKEDNGNV